MKVRVTYPKRVAYCGWHRKLKGGVLSILVDRKYSPEARKEVAYHEKREVYYEGLGLKYPKAHQLANKDECERFGRKAFNRVMGELDILGF